MMPSMDFKRVWQSGPLSAAAASGGGGARGARDTRVLSVWRPVGPPGYSSLGDVALAGSEPPSGKPVRMYKDVVGAGDAPGQVRRRFVLWGRGGLGCRCPFLQVFDVPCVVLWLAVGTALTPHLCLPRVADAAAVAVAAGWRVKGRPAPAGPARALPDRVQRQRHELPAVNLAASATQGVSSAPHRLAALHAPALRSRCDQPRPVMHVGCSAQPPSGLGTATCADCTHVCHLRVFYAGMLSWGTWWCRLLRSRPSTLCG